MRYEIQYFCVSHQGNCRPNNQDNFICNDMYKPMSGAVVEPITGETDNDMPRLFGVFDGLGGEACGEVAAYIATETASQFDWQGDIQQRLRDFCFTANDRICRYSEDNDVGTMGTTAAMLLSAPEEIYLCNIGDTKIFSFSDGVLEQISYDHVVTVAYGSKPLLSQDLGIPATELIIDPYVVKGRYNDGDTYLICSDGLTDMVGNDEIGMILKKYKPEQALDMLLNKALENGGKDNITIIILKLKKKKVPFWKRKTNAKTSVDDSITEEIILPEGTDEL